MGNSIEPNGRGWSDRQLLIGGVVVLVAATLITGVLLAKSQGHLDRHIRVTAELVNVGDGLPERADVKFRGVLVGAVKSVQPALYGRPNIVTINLTPEAAQGIPETVTARVVPSNVFAVSSVQLVDNGDAPPLHNGAVITEDTQLPTVLFQTTIDRVRQILAATQRDGTDPPVGMINLLAEATDHRGDTLLISGARIQRILTELNRLIATNSDEPSTVSALSEMAETLSATVPGLVDSMDNAVVPMRTIAEKQAELQSLLSAGLNTSATAATTFDNHADQLIGITTHLEPVVGVLAMNHDKFLPMATRLTRLSEKAMTDAWDDEHQMFSGNFILSFTPLRTYVRADCPRYGPLEGPSCHTAPETPQKFDIPQVLLPESYEPPPDLAPPPGTPLPAEFTAPASYGGNVGPVGSDGEREQLSTILGEDVNSAQQVLLGPVARGTAVTVSPAPSDAGGR
ncbi:MlaD family protein [Mycolicibacterium holsaticum]|uniref:Mammalian cell entry protein n=1 Tax=Mycolicibacterium holsaticum TaxID=152142 RepID=A0A1E3S3E4_9MYCO|nr:MCE family protein [Mycolicibacterium holsaticum]ODQ96581.1 mammalian cell entry protein [Mycolicibacterium holsaticum]